MHDRRKSREGAVNLQRDFLDEEAQEMMTESDLSRCSYFITFQLDEMIDNVLCIYEHSGLSEEDIFLELEKQIQERRQRKEILQEK